jgi:heme exporter protein D
VTYVWSAIGVAIFALAIAYGIYATRHRSPLDEARRKR